MIYSEYIKNNIEAFCEKVIAISSKLRINPDWLMATMFLESRLNHKAVNRTTNATGLIQFMPSTAESLGTTTDALKAMSNVEQLDFVYRYLALYAGRMNSFVDVYFAVFFPLAIGKPDDWILQTKYLSASIIAKQNSGYDLNRDLQITVGEVKRAIYSRLGIEEVITPAGEIVLVKKKR